MNPNALKWKQMKSTSMHFNHLYSLGCIWLHLGTLFYSGSLECICFHLGALFYLGSLGCIWLHLGALLPPYTTIFTIRLGTTIIFLGDFPSRYCSAFSCAKAAFSTSAAGISIGKEMKYLVFPLKETG